MPYAALIPLAGRLATRERERMALMIKHARRRWGVGLVAGLVAGAVVGGAPVRTQAVPIIIPPMSPIVVGVPISIPPIVAGVSEHSRGGVTWSTSGRADVDIDTDRHHGQAAAR